MPGGSPVVERENLTAPHDELRDISHSTGLQRPFLEASKANTAASGMPAKATFSLPDSRRACFGVCETSFVEMFVRLGE